MTDVNQTYGDDHFSKYKITESCCVPETNIIIYFNYTSVKKILNKKDLVSLLTIHC